MAELLRRPEIHNSDLVRHGLSDGDIPKDVHEAVEIDIKYSGYLARQKQQIERISKETHRPLPPHIDYEGISTLSKEAREKLTKVRPQTLGQASRIPGVSKADAAALLLWMELERRRTSSARQTSDTLG